MSDPSPFETLQSGYERAFGGLADALGLGPWREFSEACHGMLAAAVAGQAAQAEYLAVVAAASTTGMKGFAERLAAAKEGGVPIDSTAAFVRLWAGATEKALHERLQSEAGLRATAKLLRTQMLARKNMNRAVEVLCEAANMPTQSSLDDAHREIQELKRELRRMKTRGKRK